MPARRPPDFPPSNGEGDTRPVPSPGIAVAPGRERLPGLPSPRSTGDGEPPNEGSCVAPGTTRPALQPCSIFGCAAFAFTAGGLAVAGAFASFWGAATSNLLPCTFVNVPDLT